MAGPDRRRFLMAGAAASAAFSAPAAKAAAKESAVVSLRSDGVSLSPEEQTALLADLLSSGEAEGDAYLNGGVVRKLEERLAAMLGKEDAMFMPTGTLANNLALRNLAGEKRRVIVQEDSHVYADTMDGAQTLSGLTLIPLAKGERHFTAAALASLLDEYASEPRIGGVGALLIETPVRRCNGAQFGYEEIVAVSRECRARNIPMHLDGARLFVEAGHTGRPARDYAQHFDTVYISLYKCFSAPFGAVLAGPSSFIKSLDKDRRMFGGCMYHGWMSAAIALHHLDGYTDAYASARKKMDALIARLDGHPSYRFKRIDHGTNVIDLEAPKGGLKAIAEKLKARGVLIGVANEKAGRVLINPSLNRRSLDDLVSAFTEAAS